MTTQHTVTASYAVGYGKPPQHTRFQKRRSGNPSGRPHRSPFEYLKAPAIREAYRGVAAVVDGIAQPMTVIKTVLRKQLELAAAGDIRAMRDVLARITHIGETDGIRGVIRNSYGEVVHAYAGGDEDHVEDRDGGDDVEDRDDSGDETNGDDTDDDDRDDDRDVEGHEDDEEEDDDDDDDEDADDEADADDIDDDDRNVEGREAVSFPVLREASQLNFLLSPRKFAVVCRTGNFV